MKTLLRKCGAWLGVVLSVLILITVSACTCQPTEEPAPPPPEAKNQPPVITGLTATPAIVDTGGSALIACTASDPDGDLLTYNWTATGGSISGVGPTVTWIAPAVAGTFSLAVSVSDGRGGINSADIIVVAQAPSPPVVNHPPVITNLTATPTIVPTGGSSTLACIASDPDGDLLTYNWSVGGGSISGVGPTVTWIAPAVAGTFSLAVSVSDGRGGVDDAAVTVVVEAPVLPPTTTTLYTTGAGETGMVYEHSYSPVFFPPQPPYAGDTSTNVAIRAYFSFDIAALAGREIVSATLTLSYSTLGAPFPGFAPLWVGEVYYGPRSLVAADYNLTSTPFVSGGLSSAPMPIVLDVTSWMRARVGVSSPRFQVRAHFARETDTDGSADAMRFDVVTLTITYR